MKLLVKTLKGARFKIEATPETSVGEVKRIIESSQGQSVYPADRQMLIYQGKLFLKDGTTLAANNVAENSSLVLMLSKPKASSRGAYTASKAPVTQWEAIEDKPTFLLYSGVAVVALWLITVVALWLVTIVVGAINSMPLLPKLLELVGLGYTGWFVYRYLLFKESRKELASDIEGLKKKIAGTE